MILDIKSYFVYLTHTIKGERTTKHASSRKLCIPILLITLCVLTGFMGTSTAKDGGELTEAQVEDIGAIMRVCIPDIEKMKTWKAPKAEKLHPRQR